jgi:hypothetical protein
MIGIVVKMATVKHQPTFEILPSEAGGCLVLLIWPNGPEQQLDGFLAWRLPKRGSKTMGQAGSLAACSHCNSFSTLLL